MSDYLFHFPCPWGYLLIPVIVFAVARLQESQKSEIKAPLGMTYLTYTPRWLSNFIYGFDAIDVIGKGYSRFRNSAYKLIRNDVNMVVLPASTIPELSSLSIEVASGIKALEHDLLGKWTGLDMILESRLHHRLVQRKLTPNLSLVTPGLEDEVSKAISDCFPQSPDWTEIQPYHVLLKVSARVSSRVLVGFPICQDPRWLNIAINFTEDTPAFEKRLKELDEGSYKPVPGAQPDGFSWLAELAEGKERNPTKLAHYEILLALASVHTTLLREVNVLYDVMAEPIYIDMLRQEIIDVNKAGWSKTSYSQLEKLDSVMRESQRISPPTSIGLRRIMQEPYTLADGTHLPKGSYVCVPAYTIENDPANTTDPEKFDGLRAFNQRKKNPGSLHHFTSTETSVLGFGFGKTACPGRFFASLALKAVFVKLLSEYDFKFIPNQKERPQNILNPAPKMDTLSSARCLVQQLAHGCSDVKGIGSFTSAVYDTAWLSMVVKNDQGKQRLLFPDCFSYILREQMPDGSWKQYSSPIDGILNSLASLLSLIKYSKSGFCTDIESEYLRSCIKKAKAALSSKFEKWDVKATIHVGFELLVPSLLEQLEVLGVSFQFPQRKELDDLNHMKLRKFHPNMVYGDQQSTILHSLEAFIGKVDFDLLRHQLRSGSMLGSPAATAAYLIHSTKWDNDAEAYLFTVYNRSNLSGGVPSAFPSTVFESSWTISTLIASGFCVEDLKGSGIDIIFDFLSTTLANHHGIVGFAPGLLADSDDTAVSILVLSLGGRHHSVSKMVAEFAGPKHFHTYAKESNPSFTANCNVLLALLYCSNIHEYSSEIAKTVEFLTSTMENGIVFDKWNLSPNYSTMLLCRALTALLFKWEQGAITSVFEDTINCRIPIMLLQALLQTSSKQKENGSWENSAESTSYAVIAISKLLHLPWDPLIREYAKSVIQKGRSYLEAHTTSWVFPSYHWVEKVSYGSPILSQAYLIAALNSTTEEHDWSPRARAIFKISKTFLSEMAPLFVKTPLFPELSTETIKLPLVESYLYLKRLQTVKLGVFPAREGTSDRYLQIIPFTWVGCNFLGDFALSGSQLWEMMLLSVLIYQADEYMETVVNELDGEARENLKEYIREVCGCSKTWLRTSSSPLKLHASTDLFNESTTRNWSYKSSSGNDSSSILLLGDVTLTLGRFIQYFLRHPKLLASNISVRQNVAREICGFLLAHVRHLEDNSRLSKQSMNGHISNGVSLLRTLVDPEISYFDWVHTIATDDTSCPFAFAFFLALISEPGKYCLKGLAPEYLAKSLALQLGTMCRQYNDYGSLSRDQEENNLNSLSFPEFNIIASPGTDDQKDKMLVNTVKGELMGLAGYEKMFVELSMKQLRLLSEDTTFARIQAFVNTTDLYGQIYVLKDLTNRAK
ncbi:hypothetical protein G7Y89_g14576 [Cudoniella acicularis]|uniref:Ent-kaurene synthase n=1 Tax=Cudoniella acicularis TaxID=354080 RepID=A0A8H4R317_9HELO|nr:hypothetical protein G7Y89_g14576 [Cudoniella acicularis]